MIELKPVNVLSNEKCGEIVDALKRNGVTYTTIASKLGPVTIHTIRNYRKNSFLSHTGRYLITMLWLTNPQIHDLVDSKENESGKSYEPQN